MTIVVPGAGFSPRGRDYIRIALTVDVERMKETVRRLAGSNTDTESYDDEQPPAFALGRCDRPSNGLTARLRVLLRRARRPRLVAQHQHRDDARQAADAGRHPAWIGDVADVPAVVANDERQTPLGLSGKVVILSAVPSLDTSVCDKGDADLQRKGRAELRATSSC